MADRMGLRVDSGRKPWSTVRHAVQRIALPRVTFQIWGFKSGAATLVMKNHDRYLSADLLRGGRIPELGLSAPETMRTEWALGWTVGGNRGGQSGRTVQRIALPRVTFPIWQVGHIEPRDS